MCTPTLLALNHWSLCFNEIEPISLNVLYYLQACKNMAKYIDLLKCYDLILYIICFYGNRLLVINYVNTFNKG